MRSYLAAAIASLVLLLASHAHAGGISSFRCPDTDKLITQGMSPDEVAQRCRSPNSASEHTDTVTELVERWFNHQRIFVEVSRQVVHTEWFYDFGHSRFVRYLSFVDGRLCRITEGGYGSPES